MAPPDGGHRGATGRAGFLRPTRAGAGFSRQRQVLVLFSNDAVLCLRPGPAPAASIRTVASGGWRPCRGDDRRFTFKEALAKNRGFRERRAEALATGTLTFDAGISSALAIDAFLDCVEPRHKRQLAQLQHHSWPVYAALCRAPGMEELLEDNLGLAVALSNHAWLAARPVQWPMRSIRRLLKRKRRRDIAAALGWPNRQAAVRILARLKPEAASMRHLCTLRQLAHDPRWCQRLSHLPHISRDIMRLLGDPATRERCEMSFLLELAVREDQLRLGGLAMATLAQFKAAERPVPQLRGVEQLMGLVNEADALAHAGRQRLGRFGPPPLAGTRDIIPICSSGELDREARAQKNCLAGQSMYETGISEQKLWVYRIMAPQRCTLSIERDEPDGPWTISELHTRRNGEPTSVTRDMVEEWLEAQQKETAREGAVPWNSGDVDPAQLSLALDGCGL